MPDSFAESQAAGIAMLERLGAGESPAPMAARKRAVRRGSHRKLTLVNRHAARFSWFSLIGLFVLGAGLGTQWATVRATGTTGSYVLQAVLSIELSYLLNRLITWRDRNVPGTSLAKWNAQRIVMTVPNYLGYAAAIRYLHADWLEANLGVTAAFVIINYALGDRWSFSAVEESGFSALPATPALGPDWQPTVSVVIPCKNNPATIGATVRSLLAQSYAELTEVILVGDVGDRTWAGVADIHDPRLVIVEYEQEPGKREPNVKRHLGLLKATGDVLALADSDIVMNPGWLSTAIEKLRWQGHGLVAGGMRSISNGFWGRFVDSNVVAAKTPRLPRPYLVTAANFGKRGYKPPVTANAVFFRELYEHTPLDTTWFYGYEDYEWFWRVVKDGHLVRFDGALTAAHHHRRSYRKLLQEYRRSAEGCAEFIRKHRDCPLGRKRLAQAVALPPFALAALSGAAYAVALGEAAPVAGAAALVAAFLAVREVASARRLEAVAYPFAGAVLAGAFTLNLAKNLINPARPETQTQTWEDAPSVSAYAVSDLPALQEPRRAWRSRISWPLAAILVVQAAVGLVLVRSNTVFGDESDYLQQGRAYWNHWLHGIPLPVMHDSGLTFLYPPIGAIGAYIDGLTGARCLSLLFMLAATVLVYLTARELFNSSAGLLAAGFWALSEPALHMSAWATYDPLCCLLDALTAWIVVTLPRRRFKGEWVVVAAITLALANVAAYSFAIYEIALLAFGFLVWRTRLGMRLAIWCTGWLAIASVVFTVLLITGGHGWEDLIGSTVSRSSSGASLGYSVLTVAGDAWLYGGTVLACAVLGLIWAMYDGAHRLLTLSLVGIAFLVPVYQAHLGSSWSMDKHMTTGIWFLSLAAGYGVAAFGRVLAGHRLLPALAVVLVLLYPSVNGIRYSWSTFRSFPNVARVIADVRPLSGNVLPAGGDANLPNMLSFYLGPRVELYGASLDSADVVVAEVDGTVQSSTLLRALVPGPVGSMAALAALSAADGSSGVVAQVEKSHQFRLVAVVPFTTTNANEQAGVFAVWQRIGGK